MNATDNRTRFFLWLSRSHPGIYAQVANELRAARLGGWADTIVNAIATVGTAVMAKKQADKQISAQKKADDAARADQLKTALLQVNLQRAQANLPPVDANGQVIPQASLPAVLPTQAQAYAAADRQEFFAAVPWYVWAGGAAVVALLLLRR